MHAQFKILSIVGAAVWVYFSMQPDQPTTSSSTSTITITTPTTSSTLTAADDQLDVYNTSASSLTEVFTNDFQVQRENVLRRGVKFSELSSQDSRNLALNWILHGDPMHLNMTASRF